MARLVLTLLLVTTLGRAAQAQFCGTCLVMGPSLLSESIDGGKVVYVAKWVRARPVNIISGGGNELDVVHVIKGSDPSIKAGARIVLPASVTASRGQLLLVCDDATTAANRWTTTPMTTASADYVRRLPPSSAPERVRVRFYLRYATSADAIVSADAHLNLTYSGFPEIVRNRDVLSRRALRECFQSSKYGESQQGFFGMLLGLVGTEADQSLLEARIVKPRADSESGDFSLEGTLFGYLWLARTDGVDLVERRLITDSATFHQRYATLSAVSRLARNSGDAVLRVRCLKTIRLLLNDPEIADLCVSHLQGLKDWSALDDVLRLYLQDEIVAATKRAVVRYLIACRDHGRQEQPVPQPSRDAERYLEGLRRMDARFVADVERFVY